jgi:hypothetical protein
VPLPDDRWVLYARENYGALPAMRSFSSDEGKTWSQCDELALPIQGWTCAGMLGRPASRCLAIHYLQPASGRGVRPGSDWPQDRRGDATTPAGPSRYPECDLGPGGVMFTSVPVAGHDDISSVVAYDRDDGRFWRVDCTYVPAYYPGTGDIFASVVVGSLLQGDSLPLALDRAVQFVSTAIRASFGYLNPSREGVLLERVLTHLRAPISASSYQIID